MTKGGFSEDAARRALHELLTENTEWGAILAEYVQRIEEGFFEAEIVDAVFQEPEHGVSLYDAYCFANIHTMLREQTLCLLKLELGETAPRDHKGDTINAVLQTMGSPFQASFWGGTDDSDGILSWDSTLTFENSGQTVDVSPASIPLEVGYTKAATTWSHIQVTGGVARWPYGRESVFAFYRPLRR